MSTLDQLIPRMSDPSTAPRLHAAFMQGKRAFLRDEPKDSNPHPIGSRARIDWFDGWNKENMAANENFVEIPGTLKAGVKSIKYKYSQQSEIIA